MRNKNEITLAVLFKDREIYRTLEGRIDFQEKIDLLGRTDDYLAYRRRLLKLARKYRIEISTAR